MHFNTYLNMFNLFCYRIFLSFIIINVYRHENAIHKGSHSLYRTEAELDAFQLSNRTKSG